MWLRGDLLRSIGELVRPLEQGGVGAGVEKMNRPGGGWVLAEIIHHGHVVIQWVQTENIAMVYEGIVRRGRKHECIGDTAGRVISLFFGTVSILERRVQRLRFSSVVCNV